MIKFLILIAMTLNVMASTKIKDNVLKVGREDSQDIYIYANEGVNSPYLFFDFSDGVWKQSNDGSTAVEFGNATGNLTGARKFLDDLTPLDPFFQILSNDELTTYLDVKSTGIVTDLDMTFNSTGALTIPVGLTSERPTGVTGMTRYNTEEECLELYNGLEWFCAGVGGGGSAGINFISDASFENEKLNPDSDGAGTESYATYTIDAELYSEFNELYFQAAYTGLTANNTYVRDTFARTGLDGKQGLFSIWINVDAPGFELCLRTDDNTFAQSCDSAYLVSINGDGTWKKYEIPFLYGTSSVEYEIRNPSYTGDVNIKVDKLYIGSLPDGYIQQVGQAQFVGSLNYEATNCVWNKTTTPYGDFPVDADCEASLITGNVSAPDTKIPAIKILNARTDGYYKILFQGLFQYASGGNCAYSFSSSSSYENQSETFVGSGGQNDSTLIGNFNFDSSGDKTIRVIGQGNSSPSCSVFGSDGNPMKLIVHFYPDSTSTIVTQEIELTAKTANELTANINMTGTPSVISSDYNWIDSLTDNAQGKITINFDNLNISNPMSCIIRGAKGTDPNNPVTCQEDRTNITDNTQFSFSCSQNAALVDDQNVAVHCKKQGADVNKTQKLIGRFETIDQVNLDIPATNLDWSNADIHYKDISADTTFTFSNNINGKSILVVINNTDVNPHAITWPAGVYKSPSYDGNVEAQTETVFTFFQSNNKIYISEIKELEP
jgi:hypothetical protein